MYMRTKAWKQVCIETMDGQLIAIEHQRYLLSAHNYDILDLRMKPGWWWITDWQGYAKTNNTEVMRVRVFYEKEEQWYDILWKYITKNWVHRLR